MGRRHNKPTRKPDFIVGGQEFFIGEMLAYNTIHERVIKLLVIDGKLANNASGYPETNMKGWFYYHNPEVHNVFHKTMTEIEKILIGD